MSSKTRFANVITFFSIVFFGALAIEQSIAAPLKMIEYPQKGFAGGLPKPAPKAPESVVPKSKTAPAPVIPTPAKPAPRASAGDTLLQQVNMKIVIDLSTQSLTVFDGHIAKFTCDISSGRPGFETPTGKTEIVSKRPSHYSKQYQCQMPWALELGFVDKNGTLRGIFIHEGQVRKNKFPASHACVRVPKGAAEKLFKMVPLLTRVEVTGSIIEYLDQNFEGAYLLELVDGKEPRFKMSPNGTLTQEFVQAFKSKVIMMDTRDENGHHTKDKTKWVIGWPFLKRSNCIPVLEYERQTGESVYFAGFVE